MGLRNRKSGGNNGAAVYYIFNHLLQQADIIVLQILSHRGYWETDSEKNSEAAFRRSFFRGNGTETDIRDYRGDLVISHDIAHDLCMSVKDFFEIYCQSGSIVPLALNIKSDGLHVKLYELLMAYEIKEYFVFDMSIPDTVNYIKSGIRYFTRQSEYEPIPPLYEQASGVWMDCFLGDWIEEYHIERHLSAGKQVCLVSPELHKRAHKSFWLKLSKMRIVESANIMLCSDFVEEAQEFFHG